MDEPSAEPTRPPDALTGYLYDAAGQDRAVKITEGVIETLHERAILWVDLSRGDRGEIRRVGELLQLNRGSIAELMRPPSLVRLDNYGSYLQFSALAAPTFESRSGELPSRPRSLRVDFVVGRNWLITIHDQEVGYLRAFRGQDKADTETGALSAGALAASLLDWHLEGFFTEVSHIEATVDELDERILGAPSDAGLLETILSLRRRTSALRRTLMAQRSIFYGLGRPDLSRIVDGEGTGAFASLANRFERAVDEIEHTRDLSVGSFELFTSRSAQQTNDLDKALTFFTVIIGTTAAVAGLFGMNFNPPFFQSGSIGFFAVTLGLFVVGLAAWIVGKRQRWI